MPGRRRTEGALPPQAGQVRPRKSRGSPCRGVREAVALELVAQRGFEDLAARVAGDLRDELDLLDRLERL